MFSSDKSKQKKRRSVETNVSYSSTEKPIQQAESRIRKGRSHPSLLNIPLHPSGSVQNASVNRDTDEKSEYQNMSYTDKLSIAIQMVPNLLAGDVKETLEKLLHDPTFTAELVAVGAVFVGLQATPAGPFIDAAMVATLGVDVALKLGGFLYKSYTAHNEDDLKEAAEDLKGFVEVAGLAGATKLLGMAGRTLKNLRGEATAVEGGTLRTLSDKEAANIWGGAGPGKAKPSKVRKVHKERSSEQRAQKTVSQADQPLQNPLPNAAQRGHGHDWHGNQTTDLQQELRVKTGTRPDGSTGRAPGTASRFTSPQAEAEALGRADRLLGTDLKNGNVPSFPDPRTGKPTYVDPVTGKPVRHAVTVSTQRQGGFGTRVVKQRDPITRQVLRDPATGQPITARDPIPRSNAKVIWEYRPTTGDWKPVTYYPD